MAAEPEDVRLPGESDEESEVASIAGSTKPGRRRKRKKNHKRIVVQHSGSKYEVVRRSLRSLGWRSAKQPAPGEDCEEANLLWADSYISFDTLSALHKYQKANHFPGMSELAKKNLLAKNLNRMARVCAEDFAFFPPSFNLPAELEPLRTYVSAQRRKPTLIVKPDSGCQGRGIFLTKNPDELSDVDGVVAQQYIASPLLVEGVKFDLRLYVLLVSCDPMRILLFKEGLARFCTERYRAPTDANLEQAFAHLTNFAVNKHHESFEIDDDGDAGHKRCRAARPEPVSFPPLRRVHPPDAPPSLLCRSLTSLFQWLREHNLPAERVWSQIKAPACARALQHAALPHIVLRAASRLYSRVCFIRRSSSRRCSRSSRTSRTRTTGCWATRTRASRASRCWASMFCSTTARARGSSR